MKPTELSVRILHDIREEIRGLREEQREFRQENAARFETLETTLRDLAEQLVTSARGFKVAIGVEHAHQEECLRVPVRGRISDTGVKEGDHRGEPPLAVAT